MKKDKIVNPSFKFWIDNKTANERVFFVSDLKQVFEKWLRTRDRDWLDYYDSRSIILYFVTDKSGLSSTIDQKDTQELVRLLKPELQKALSVS